MAGAWPHLVAEHLPLKPGRKKEGRRTGHPQEKATHPRRRNLRRYEKCLCIGFTRTDEHHSVTYRVS